MSMTTPQQQHVQAVNEQILGSKAHIVRALTDRLDTLYRIKCGEAESMKEGSIGLEETHKRHMTELSMHIDFVGSFSPPTV